MTGGEGAWHLLLPPLYTLFVKIKIVASVEAAAARTPPLGMDSGEVKNRLQPSGSARLIDGGRGRCFKLPMNINFWHLRYRSDTDGVIILKGTIQLLGG